MTTHAAPARPLRPSRVGIVAAALAATVAGAILSPPGGSSPTSSTAGEATMRSLPPQERRYVKGVIALTPQQQRAAYSPQTHP
jgi:hypothetical protein